MRPARDWRFTGDGARARQRKKVESVKSYLGTIYEHSQSFVEQVAANP